MKAESVPQNSLHVSYIPVCAYKFACVVDHNYTLGRYIFAVLQFSLQLNCEDVFFFFHVEQPLLCPTRFVTGIRHNWNHIPQHMLVGCPEKFVHMEQVKRHRITLHSCSDVSWSPRAKWSWGHLCLCEPKNRQGLKVRPSHVQAQWASSAAHIHWWDISWLQWS